jgi:hypothetical protein
VIETREEVPEGALARDAIATLFLEGRIFKGSLDTARQTLEAAGLARKLSRAHWMTDRPDLGAWASDEDIPTLEAWLDQKLATLGVRSGEDLALLSPDDLMPDDLPEETRAWLDREFPRRLSLGDVKYKISYDIPKKVATLVMTEGKRKNPPPLTTLPALRGFKVRAKHHSKVWVLRES